jgi:hypothetical protein
MLIVRRNQTAELGLPEEMSARFREFTQSLRATGALLAVEHLKPSAQGATVRRQDGLMTIEGRPRNAPSCGWEGPVVSSSTSVSITKALCACPTERHQSTGTLTVGWCAQTWKSGMLVTRTMS